VTSNRDVVEQFFAASERGDVAALAKLVDDDIVMEWPQSGERFRGLANVFGATRAVDVKPELAGQPRLTGSGDVWVLMAPLRYGADRFEYVAVLELEGGRVRRATGYWGAPFPASTSRAPFVDRRPDASD
jgi:SnoaL-like domain